MQHPTCVIEDITEHSDPCARDRQGAGAASVKVDVVDAPSADDAAAAAADDAVAATSSPRKTGSEAAPTAPADRSGGGSAESDSDKRSDQLAPGAQDQQQQEEEEQEEEQQRPSEGATTAQQDPQQPGTQEQSGTQQQPGTQQPGTQQQPWEPASDEERAALARAEALKLQGNELYGSDRADEALLKYKEAVDAAPEGAARQRAVYYANMAAACLKLKQPSLAAEHCSCALRADPSYVKALMRRSAAREELDDLDGALADARATLELAPDSAWAAAAARRLEPLVRERQEKLKEEMMGKLKDLGNAVLGKFGLSLDNFKAEQDPATGGYSIKFSQ